VSATLSGLQASTTYYYELQVTRAGQTYTGSIESFTTDSTPGAPQTPVAATGSAARVSASGALLTGTVNPGGASAVTYAFSYGTSPSQLDQSTPTATQPGSSTAAPVSATLTGLSQTTTYYFQLDVSLNGQTYSGAVQTFRTSTPPPSVTTGRTSRVDGQGVTVSGAVNPAGAATTYLVEFGTSTAYGYSSKATPAGSGNSSVPVSVALDGLSPQTTYHYRLVATNAGGTSVGSDRTFRTARAVGQAPGFSFNAPGRLSVRRLLSHHLRVHFKCTKACTARFVLTVAPAGVSQARAVAVAIARGSAKLHRRGWGIARLWFVHAGRRHARRLRRGKRVRLVLQGYANAHGSAPSRPELARIALSK
jgi:phosphodiesterase/alkaline phosphatase D-like protein